MRDFVPGEALPVGEADGEGGAEVAAGAGGADDDGDRDAECVCLRGGMSVLILPLSPLRNIRTQPTWSTEEDTGLRPLINSEVVAAIPGYTHPSVSTLTFTAEGQCFPHTAHEHANNLAHNLTQYTWPPVFEVEPALRDGNRNRDFAGDGLPHGIRDTDFELRFIQVALDGESGPHAAYRRSVGLCGWSTC